MYGMNNRGSITPDQAAVLARALGIRVYTIGAGTHGYAPFPVRDPFGVVRYIRQPVDIDEPMLRRVASETQGAYYRATDYEALGAIYEEIDRLERTEIEVGRYTLFEERFLPFVLAGWVLLAAERAWGLSRGGALPA